MATLRGLRRLLFFVIYCSAYLIESALGRLFLRTQEKRREFHSRVVSRYCRLGCFLLNVRVRAIGLPPPEKHFLLVGNHLGFLDILVTASVQPTLFITSVEMRETPLLGTLCEMGGCLFVERRSRANILNEMGEIREALQQGFSVALYPEGTSGNGEKVLPFKKTMLMAAAGTGVPIKVMVINYRKINDQPMSDIWRNYVCWYGDMTFGSALWRLLCLESIDVDLSFHEEVVVHSEEERQAIAARVQHLVETHYDPIPFPRETSGMEAET